MTRNKKYILITTIFLILIGITTFYFFVKPQLFTSDAMLLKTSSQNNNKTEINNKIEVSQENFNKRLKYITNNELKELPKILPIKAKEKELRKQYQQQQMSFMSQDEKESYENILKINNKMDDISLSSKKINKDIKVLERQYAEANEQEKRKIEDKINRIGDTLQKLSQQNKQLEKDQTLAITRHNNLFQNLQTKNKFSQIDIQPYENALKEIYNIKN
ncbi:MAG: hypothetical protein QS2022_2150 [Candidatus Phytoplasma asteris]|uniref:DnaJ-class molecular chaperone n=1 Tax='Chrysanthemum coronarium' phytoplasma TaxID=1520703 RepID=A0ABQ0J2X8_9MOLU|nr:hypothetical protein ['Chrysanthemum coronarium' phytoplasma]TKA87993.1 MAG: putative secreted protein [Periwinkle leaf yellowing phytoplasma]WEX19491.1 MAG: hypothetical protein QS2022_2150 [Candidatus Phytoplasma asteris]GAK73960.1 dnaJ-class molecular chaperone ['Chrysanthemum coronarium' phytoplasma]